MSLRKLFRDRTDAGHELALRLRPYREASPVVLGLPRGGVPVAYEVARELGAPLDVCVVRKIGAPIQPELGIGAVAEDGAIHVDHDLQRRVRVSDAELAQLVKAKRAEVDDRVQRFRRGAAPVDVRGKTILVVDDGIATGGTARAALQTLRARGAARIVLAVPVGASDTLDELASVADEIVCLSPEEDFFAVGVWYDDFTPTTDDDVVELLDRARAEYAAVGHGVRNMPSRNSDDALPYDHEAAGELARRPESHRLR
jgi:putative phosphoribosyl transferase